MQRKKINEARMDETWNQRGERNSPVADGCRCVKILSYISTIDLPLTRTCTHRRFDRSVIWLIKRCVSFLFGSATLRFLLCPQTKSRCACLRCQHFQYKQVQRRGRIYQCNINISDQHLPMFHLIGLQIFSFEVKPGLADEWSQTERCFSQIMMMSISCFSLFF